MNVWDEAGLGESLSPPARAELTGPDDEKNIARFASRSETGRGERGAFARFMTAGAGSGRPDTRVFHFTSRH